MENVKFLKISVRDQETEEGNEPNRSLTEAEQSTNSKNPEEVAKNHQPENEKNEIELTDNEKSNLSLIDAIKKIELSGKLSISGRVTKYDGHFLECDGFPAKSWLHLLSHVTTSDGTETKAEIIGFKKGNNILSMFEADTRIQSGAKVSFVDDGFDVDVGESLLGRVVDAMGDPL